MLLNFGDWKRTMTVGYGLDYWVQFQGWGITPRGPFIFFSLDNIGFPPGAMRPYFEYDNLITIRRV
jgi:hypothetical protein